MISLDKIQGCLLGHAIGDAVGAPFEGWSAQNIYDIFGSSINIVKKPSSKTIYYTDDTQMSIGVCEQLILQGEIDEINLCTIFVDNFDSERGYGGGARKLLASGVQAIKIMEMAKNNLPGGSFGNGAAMRVAPLGLVFGTDIEQLKQQVESSAKPTHTHPLAIEGAQLLAISIAMVCKKKTIDKNEFLEILLGHAVNDEYKGRLNDALKLSDDESLNSLGSSIKAHESVVTAIMCFLRNIDSYEATIANAISLGNDTDTLAAMAGGLSGAYLGIKHIPQSLLDRLEDDVKGKTYLFGLADGIHHLTIE